MKRNLIFNGDYAARGMRVMLYVICVLFFTLGEIAAQEKHYVYRYSGTCYELEGGGLNDKTDKSSSTSLPTTFTLSFLPDGKTIWLDSDTEELCFEGGKQDMDGLLFYTTEDAFYSHEPYDLFVSSDKGCVVVRHLEDIPDSYESNVRYDFYSFTRSTTAPDNNLRRKSESNKLKNYLNITQKQKQTRKEPDWEYIQNASVGNPLPLEAFVDINGEDVPFSIFCRGKYTLVVTDFLFCTPSINLLNRLKDAGIGEHVVVVHDDICCPQVLKDAKHIYRNKSYDWCFGFRAPFCIMLDSAGNVIKYSCGFSSKYPSVPEAMISLIKSEMDSSFIGENQIAYTAYINDKDFQPGTKWGDAELLFKSYKYGRHVLTFDRPLEVIPDNAFRKFVNLRTVTLPKSLTTIGASAFEQCPFLVEIRFPDNITKIKDSAFANCKSLKSVKIPNKVSWIGHNAFCWCDNLEELDLGWGALKVGAYSFNGCKKLMNVIIPRNVQYIETQAFGSCSGKLVINCQKVCDGGSWLNKSAFSDISIGGNVTEIGTSLFSGYESLTSVTISEGVTRIEDKAFEGCVNLRNISIPKTVCYIGEEAFRRCINLDDVILPERIWEIKQDTFSGCSNLKNITIPDGVSKIGSGAFCACDSLTSISLPDSVTEVSWFTFAGCDNLKSIISKYATQDKRCFVVNGFMQCFIPNGLVHYTIPQGITHVGTFEGCKNLETVTFSDSVTSVGSRAFYHCDQLKAIYFVSKTPPDPYYSIFDSNGKKNVKIYVPARYAGRYKRVWKDYKKMIVKNKDIK